MGTSCKTLCILDIFTICCSNSQWTHDISVLNWNVHDYGIYCNILASLPAINNAVYNSYVCDPVWQKEAYS